MCTAAATATAGCLFCCGNCMTAKRQMCVVYVCGKHTNAHTLTHEQIYADKRAHKQQTNECIELNQYECECRIASIRSSVIYRQMANQIERFLGACFLFYVILAWNFLQLNFSLCFKI